MEFAEKVCAKLWMSVEKKEKDLRAEKGKNTLRVRRIEKR
jgi:hypothetical protein